MGSTTPGATTNTCAETEEEEADPEVALIVTAMLCVSDGAVYFPLASMVPTVEFPPDMPSTDQTVPWALPDSVVSNWIDWPSESATALGEMEVALWEEDPQPTTRTGTKRQKYTQALFIILHPWGTGPLK